MLTEIKSPVYLAIFVYHFGKGNRSVQNAPYKQL